IGLFHVCPQNSTKIMEPGISTNYDGVRHDELRAGQSLYGDFFEINDTAALATDLGTLAPGPFSFGTPPPPAVTNGSTMGISQDNDVDYYKVSLAGPTLLAINVTPVGMVYASGTQNDNGTCSAGTSFNSGQIQRLEFQFSRSDLSPLGTFTGAPAAAMV